MSPTLRVSTTSTKLELGNWKPGKWKARSWSRDGLSGTESATLQVCYTCTPQWLLQKSIPLLLYAVLPVKCFVSSCADLASTVTE